MFLNTKSAMYMHSLSLTMSMTMGVHLSGSLIYETSFISAPQTVVGSNPNWKELIIFIIIPLVLKQSII